MDDMAQTKHAKTRAEGLVAAWLCLVIAGAATVTFNIVHAWRSGMASPLGFVEGVVPVALAMIVSHLVATSSAGKFLKTVTFAVMIGALALSVRATGTVVAPAAGPLWWLYGAVVDTAALVSLQVLLALKARVAQAERDRAAAEAAAADERTALRAELGAARAALAPLQADLATARTELARMAAKAEAAEARADKLKAATARKRGTATARKRAPATARKSEAATGPATAPETDSDIAREALVLKYLAEGKSASEAGRMAGLTDSRGRQIARKLATAAPKGQDEAEGS